MPIRVVLFGTGEFALPTFAALMDSTDCAVLGVFTQPDRTGRGHHRHINRVKVLAEDHGIPVFQPERVNQPEVLEGLRNLAADVFVVAAYGQILKPEFLSIPPLGAFNLHGSLLPRHRGAAPVQYAIWNGDREAGVTIFQIEPALDSGPMIGKVSTEIGARETAAELMLRLADLSVDLTQTALCQLAAGTAVFEEQDESLITLAPKISKQDGRIDWSQSAGEIDCHIRAMQPWPRASTWLHAGSRSPMRCILRNAEAAGAAGAAGASSAPPGTVIHDGNLVQVATGNGLLTVHVIQPDGKQAMDAISFVNGYGIGKDARFADERM